MGFGDLVGKAKDLAKEHAEQVEGAIDKVGDVVDEKTEGKYESMVDKAQDAAKKFAQD
ncbi:antitoxin [Smaragdicoccus niigatensis]|uniref:antitoxin n=1 Tax=Smaragdicoccus niigatensis TaxID=359359 RepID=UPI0003716AF3|nr:antitoxin [Smaragdicoccus niigatensis]